MVTCRRDNRSGSQFLEMSHDGYRPLFGVVHRRRLVLSEEGASLTGEDRLTGGRSGLAYNIRAISRAGPRSRPGPAER
ncbi:MAG: heparinase II/III family protein [Rhodospirillales bacterium]|nr:heparinase II/III family protein [Rhodospirillales bacterium]